MASAEPGDAADRRAPAQRRVALDPGSGATGGARREARLRSRVLGALAALAAALALLGLGEGGLRLLGIGAPPRGQESALAYQHVFLPVLEAATLSDGSDVWQTADRRHAWDAVRRPKPPGELRILALGGSATAGLGYSPNAAFPALLEDLLAESGAEVVNLGTVALPAAGVATMAEDLLGYAEPDLLVVYSGNNEFLELHSRRYFEATAPALARARAALARTHLARLARALLASAPRRIDSRSVRAAGARVDQRHMLEVVRITEAEREAVEKAYEDSLERIAESAEAAGVPLLLVGVAGNERWWGLHDFDPAAAPPASPAHALHRRLYAEALAAEAAGDLDTARRQYRAALEADPHLRRGTARLRARARAVAERHEGVVFLDARDALAARAPDGILGFETFYDYVHFTPRGALALAEEIAAALAKASLAPAPRAEEQARVRRALEARLRAPQDALAVGEWLGFSDDPGRISERDLWKYDRMLDALDRRIARNPQDWRARAWRGDAAWFETDGAERAALEWNAALEALGSGGASAEPDLRANVARLRGAQALGAGGRSPLPRR